MKNKVRKARVDLTRNGFTCRGNQRNADVWRDGLGHRIVFLFNRATITQVAIYRRYASHGIVVPTVMDAILFFHTP